MKVIKHKSIKFIEMKLLILTCLERTDKKADYLVSTGIGSSESQLKRNLEVVGPNTGRCKRIKLGTNFTLNIYGTLSSNDVFLILLSKLFISLFLML